MAMPATSSAAPLMRRPVDSRVTARLKVLWVWPSLFCAVVMLTGSVALEDEVEKAKIVGGNAARVYGL